MHVTSSRGHGGEMSPVNFSLRAYDSVRDARASLGRYLAFYNGRRPHSSLGARTPEQAYLDHLPQAMAA